MTDTLHALAEAAGLALRWKNWRGEWQSVGPDTLRAVLRALGLPAAHDAEAAESLASLRHPSHAPPLLTADAGGALHIAGATGRYELVLEDGRILVGQLPDVAIPDEPGYHRLQPGDGSVVVIAVAPKRGWTLADATQGPQWGLAVQLYSLRRAGDGGIGDFGGLAEFVGPAARAGAACVAISPVHAQFSATTDRFSPYSPSSRVLLNVLHATIDVTGPEAAALEAAPLIDWPAATRLRQSALAAQFDAADVDCPEFAAFRREIGEPLEQHARFEALHAHMTALDGAHWNWRTWPGGLSDSGSAVVAAFVRDNAREVTRHAYYQFLADRSMAAAQRAARQAGMPVGLVADLAVGVDAGGSQCWGSPGETLNGLSIGAPPDMLSVLGQNWGLVAYSPVGLRLNGFDGYIAMLRAAMRHAGGVRIDHAMGLARLWVVPDGGSAADGAYLSFPLDDMLRLIRLESWRNQAIVMAEDLGTVPDGFQHAIGEAGMLGMRILWFERALDLGFKAPAHWDPGAAAMTSTHDLATIAGWWTGGDLAWRERTGMLGDPANIAREQADRIRDRGMLWASMCASGAAKGDPPPPDEPAAAVDAATLHVAGAACTLAMLPIEDALGLVEQPNLPGTLDEHPNWRRRMPGAARTLLDPPAMAARLRAFDAERKSV